jgi:hypothetical protein
VKIKDIADAEGFHTISVEAHEGKRLPELLLPGVRKALISLSAIATAKEHGRRGLMVLRSFISSVKVSVNDVEYGLSIAPEVGTADSGDLESDLPELMLALGEAAKAAKKPIAILIDELQYLSTSEFSALIMSVHRRFAADRYGRRRIASNFRLGGYVKILCRTSFQISLDRRPG